MEEVENLKNNNLIDSFRSLYKNIRLNIRFLAFLSFAFAVAGFIYSTTLSAPFKVYAEIQPAESQQGQTSANPFNILQVNSLTNDIAYFESKMFSSSVAKKLWNKGYADIFFSSYYNESKDQYLRSPGYLEILKSKILSYEIDKTVDHVNLSEMISGTFLFEKKSRDSQSYIIYALSNQPEMYEDLLFNAILETDNEIKRTKLKKVKTSISFLQNKVANTEDMILRASLTSLLQKELLEEILLSGDDYYSIEVIEDAQTSKNPDYIDLSFIYFAFILIGFFIGLIFIYIKKNI